MLLTIWFIKQGIKDGRVYGLFNSIDDLVKDD